MAVHPEDVGRSICLCTNSNPFCSSACTPGYVHGHVSKEVVETQHNGATLILWRQLTFAPLAAESNHAMSLLEAAAQRSAYRPPSVHSPGACSLYSFPVAWQAVSEPLHFRVEYLSVHAIPMGI